MQVLLESKNKKSSNNETDDYYYHLGEIVMNSTCKPQVCQLDGRIKVDPVKCPDLQLQCADPIIPIGSCCPECPNGMTCAYGKYIVRYGENKVIGNKICRCEGAPWFPNAFCAEMKASAMLLKYFGNYLAPYKPYFDNYLVPCKPYFGDYLAPIKPYVGDHLAAYKP
ncbi:hypothetical protein CHS0354_023523 [Potamilus streckersoni]|uniref:Uncharacterized protein n=1 Tax=Potamilus streckersoni TaxID=2493646 RepID=A0AAE0RVW3_9BIVA|nr:hypothetical protein CHS0354_023523 [Potamilus streckersoni]